MRKTSFSERLAQLMAEKELSQSDLARLVWGTMTDERGYEVARNRQTLGKHLQGKVEPRVDTKRKMAQVLKVSLSELDPASDPTKRPGSGIRLEEISAKEALLEVKLKLPKKVAREVVKLLVEYAR